MWKRYRFKTYAVQDYRPLEFNPKYPWWCSGYGENDDKDYAVIVAYLPKDEDLYKYWDDAFEVNFTEEDKIEFSSRFPKPSYFNEEKQREIPINIWDDFYDDGYVPEGEIQDTYIYVEDSEISLDDKKKYLEHLLSYMQNNLKLDGVKMWLEMYESRKKYPSLVGTEHESMLFDRYEIKVEHLTHERLHTLLDELESAKLEMDGMPFRIYSES